MTSVQQQLRISLRVSAQITEPSAFATARWIEGAGLDALAASSVV